MKSIIIIVTDEDGTLLDRQNIEVDSRTNKIAFRALTPNGESRPDESELVIGL